VRRTDVAPTHEPLALQEREAAPTSRSYAEHVSGANRRSTRQWWMKSSSSARIGLLLSQAKIGLGPTYDQSPAYRLAKGQGPAKRALSIGAGGRWRKADTTYGVCGPTIRRPIPRP
jgi:hypothetical protein